jgi:hypothetical protein
MTTVPFLYDLYDHQNQILDCLKSNKKGYISSPTASGKTFTFITDSRRFLLPGKVILIVAPQLMLSEQLFSEFDNHLPDVDFYYRQVSSEPKKFERDRKKLKFRITPPKSPTTNIEDIRDTYRIAQKLQKPLILFVTYDSLDRIVSSSIPVDAVYYDEAHNATSSDHFNSVKSMSDHATHNYFFTATPRFSQSRSVNGSGMDNVSVYGEQIANVSFQELVDQGIIVSPWIHLVTSDADTDKMDETSVNLKTIKSIVNNYETDHSDTPAHKILFCAQGTKSIQDLMNAGLQEWATEMGYKVLSIDSVNKGYVDGKRNINKSEFIKTLNQLGKDPNQKMIVLHYSMLGEGIDVKGFTGVVFLRNTLSKIFTTQSIGRVIRSAPGKKYGIVTIVQHDNNTNESRELIRQIVDQLFKQGVPVSEIFTEVQGRGKEDEIVESLDEDLKKLIREYHIQFEHNNILQELLNIDVEEFSF